MHAAILILAAGSSSRMRGGDKLLEEVAGMPLLARITRAALDTGLPVTVALPPDRPARAGVLDGLAVVSAAAQLGEGHLQEQQRQQRPPRPGDGHVGLLDRRHPRDHGGPGHFDPSRFLAIRHHQIDAQLRAQKFNDCPQAPRETQLVAQPLLHIVQRLKIMLHQPDQIGRSHHGSQTIDIRTGHHKFRTSCRKIPNSP